MVALWREISALRVERAQLVMAREMAQWLCWEMVPNMPTSQSFERVRAQFVQSSEMPSFKRFQEIQLDDIGYSWSITLRIEAKFPIYRDSQRFVLMDTMGCKLVAVVNGPETERFNRLLQQGRDYTISNVRFQFKPHTEFGNVQSNYECRLDHLSAVKPWNMPIQFPVCSNHLMFIREVMHCPRNTYIGIRQTVLTRADTTSITRIREVGHVSRIGYVSDTDTHRIRSGYVSMKYRQKNK